MSATATRVFFFAVLHLSLVLGQAPGDGNGECLELNQPYSSGMVPLMDTNDYKQLVLFGDEKRWQTVNEDDDEQDKWQTWSSSCSTENIAYGCNADLPQNNWLITQHISIMGLELPVVHVEIESRNFSDPPCPHCSVSLSLYVWQTSSIRSEEATDTGLYKFIANFSSPNDTPETQKVTVHLPSTEETGFYLGIRDNGSCVSITRVVVYYTVCEGSTVGLVRVRNRTMFAPATNNIVQGVCVDNSVPVSGYGPQLICTETGEWTVLSGCRCLEDYWMDDAGNQCLRPPSAPLNVTVYNVTNSSVSLSWLPPASGSTHSSAGLYYSITYGVPSKDNLIMHTSVNSTHVHLRGLTPHLPYTFSVTAENAVSSQFPDTTDRTVHARAHTKEGVGGKVTDIRVDMNAEPPISWQEPDPPQGIILHYNLKLKVFGSERELTDVVHSSSISQEVVVGFAVGRLSVEVQAVTVVGGGEFSDPVFFNVTEQGDTGTTASNFPQMELIIGIAAAIIVLILVIIAILCIIKCMKRPSKTKVEPTRSHKRNDIEEYASIALSPTDSNFVGITPPPPVARSPRPTVPGQDGCVQDVDGFHLYQVLDGPTTKTPGSNNYSIEPMQGQEYSTPTDVSDTGPLYQELEDPRNSSLMKRRVGHASPNHPGRLKVGEDVYWNEGLCPDHSHCPTAVHKL